MEGFIIKSETKFGPGMFQVINYQIPDGKVKAEATIKCYYAVTSSSSTEMII